VVWQDRRVDIGVPGVEDAEEIGAGGFGWVYRAKQPAFGRTVAVKVLRGRMLDQRVVERFQRECKAIGAVSGHPNIVHVHDAGTTPLGHPFMVMEYLSQGSLGDRLDREGPLRWSEVARIGVKVAAALHTAHRAGVLHRDLKPENILVSEYGEPLLADFGIARVEGAKETTAGVVTASFAHAPPEVVAGQRADARADVYSLASLLHALLTGSAPFLRDTDESVLPMLARISSEPPPDLRPYGVPAPLIAVIDRAMAKRPEDRPDSALAFGRELQAAQQSAGQVPTELPVPADEAPGAPPDLPTLAVSGLRVEPYTPPPQRLTPVPPPLPSGSSGPGPRAPADVPPPPSAPSPSPGTGQPPGPAPTPVPVTSGPPAVPAAAGGLPPLPPHPPSGPPLAPLPGPPRPDAGQPRRGKLIVGLVAGVAVLAVAATGLALVAGGGDGGSSTSTTQAALGPSTPEATVDRTPGSRRETTTLVEPVTTTVPLPGVPVKVASATATSTAPNNVDRCGNPTSYEPIKATDGDLATAWRAPGDASGTRLNFTLAAPAVVTKVGLVPGFAKVDACDGTDRFRQNRRVSRVQWRVGINVFEQDLQDTPGMQTITIPAMLPNTSVGLLVEGTRLPGDRDFTAISEILIEGRP
jgi:serine/threonine protein kinase